MGAGAVVLSLPPSELVVKVLNVLLLLQLNASNLCPCGLKPLRADTPAIACQSLNSGKTALLQVSQHMDAFHSQPLIKMVAGIIPYADRPVGAIKLTPEDTTQQNNYLHQVSPPSRQHVL